MKTFSYKTLMLFFSLGFLFTFSSCNKNFNEFFDEQFPEPSNTSSDMIIDGELAVPVLNTEFTLKNFIPSTDSSLWAEVDENDLVHLRMYLKNVVSLTASEIYNPLVFPLMPDSNSVSTDSNKLKVYDNALSGHLFFNDPKFTFIIKNEIPVVTFFKIDTLRLHSPAYNATYVRDDKKYYINAPQVQNATEQTELIIDKTEIPDFEDFFSPIPKFVSFFITAGSDEIQTLPPTFPFVTGNEKISVDVDVDLPLDARLVDLVMGDTINFKLDTTQNHDEIESIKIKLFLNNEFPVQGVTQLAFADTNNHGGIDDIIMYLFEGDGWVFESAIANPNGVTTSSVSSEIVMEITQEQIKLLADNHASKIIFTIKLDSYQSDTGQDVKIFGWYKLGVKLGFKVKYTANTGNLPQ